MKSKNINKIKKNNNKNQNQINILKSKLTNINGKKSKLSNNKKKKLSRADLIKKKNLQDNSRVIKGEIKELKSNLVKDDNGKNKRLNKRLNGRRPSSKNRKKLSANKGK